MLNDEQQTEATEAALSGLQTATNIQIPAISVVIPTYGQKGVELLPDCLDSLHQFPDFIPEIIVVDDGSAPQV